MHTYLSRKKSPPAERIFTVSTQEKEGNEFMSRFCYYYSKRRIGDVGIKEKSGAHTRTKQKSQKTTTNPFPFTINIQSLNSKFGTRNKKLLFPSFSIWGEGGWLLLTPFFFFFFLVKLSGSSKRKGLFGRRSLPTPLLSSPAVSGGGERGKRQKKRERHLKIFVWTYLRSITTTTASPPTKRGRIN